MRKSFILLLFLIFPLISCTGEPVEKVKVPKKYGSYSTQWQEVQKFENDGKPRSAIKVIEEIIKKAKKEKNSPQVVKGLIGLTKNVMNIGDVKFADQIKILVKESKDADKVTKAVLDSMLAEIFWTYYESNRYRFMQRSETAKVESDDISTWDLKTIIKKVKDLHLSALKNADVLKQFKIELYDEILITGLKPRKLRPTLYDFLAHRALQFFMYSDVSLTEVADPFKMISPDYFGSAEQFIALTHNFKNEDSLQAQALKIFSDVTFRHLKDKEPDALIDVELLRLKYVNDNIVTDNREELYLKALKRLEKKFPGNQTAGLIRYEIACWYRDNGNVYQPQMKDNDERKWYLKKAVNICDGVIKKDVSAEAADKCNVLISQLKSRTVSVQTEDVNTPEKPFRTFVTFRNVKNLYFRAVKLDEDDFLDLVRNKKRLDETVEELRKEKPEKTWSVKLPDDGDLRSHTTEIAAPELKKGFYAIVAGTKKDLSLDKAAVFYTLTTMSNLSLITRQSEKGVKVFIADRESGKPVKSAKVKAYSYEYSNWRSKYVTEKIGSYSTNNDGISEIKVSRKRGYYQPYILVKKGDDVIYSDFYVPYQNYSRANDSTFFFTDRAIYRPGQKIYFKGIMVRFDRDRKPTLLKNRKTLVKFYDVNGQQTAKINLKTDEFGSFHGSFNAPEGVLNGQMRIQNEYGTKYLSVEEYKRPKFETEILPTEKSYRLNEKVEVKGLAKSYTGFPLSGAKVSYTVSRSTYFPYGYWWYGSGGYYPAGGGQVVMTNGEVKTDEKGEFKIEFTAKPDLMIPQEYNPAFTYSVNVDVTDINGETHSAFKMVRVGYTSLMLTENIPVNLDGLKGFEFNVGSTNLDRQPVEAKGNLEIRKLIQPKTLLRKRLWQNPDKFVMAEDEFRKKFPHDIYDREENFAQWKEEKAVFKKVFDTSGKQKMIKVDTAKWKEGKYVVKMTSKDKYGKEVNYRKYFDVYRSEDGKIEGSEVSRIFLITNAVEPGNDAEIYIGSAAEDVTALLHIFRNNEKTGKIRVEIDHGKKVIKIPIKEKDRGGIAYSVIFQKFGRTYHQSGSIHVPWTNKELKIETMTFRDKLTPGKKEEWRLKITGPKAQAATAQMLALMYDSSLDSFVRHNIWFNIHPTNYFNIYWTENSTHRATYSRQYAPNWYSYYYGKSWTYDSFNWNGFPRHAYYNYRYSRRAKMAMPMAVTKSVGSGRGGGGVVMDEVAEEESYGFSDMEMDGAVTQTAVAEKKAERSSLGDMSKDKTVSSGKDSRSGEKAGGEVQIRKNFQETAFFMPVLKTDEKGEIVVAFEVPDSLTKWHFMGLAHTQDLKIGHIDKYVNTIKELMVTPNVPRFLREGDSVVLSAKISNMSEKKMTGSAKLELFDAMTMKSVSKAYGNFAESKKFSVKANGNTNVEWKLKVPMMGRTLTWRVVAQSGELSDGEENVLPVLSNRMMVTESLPLPVNGKEKKEFKFKKLLESGSSKTLTNHKLTLEFTSNPTWYAVQAIPYLVEYPYECAEQIFSRLYANSLSMHIVKSNPVIKQVFEKWRGTDAMLSNLHKNQELKSVLLKETPWVLDSQNEEANKKRLANFFETKRMQRGLDSAARKLKKMQAYNGGWPWFPGFPESWFITQHIVSGFGKLRNMDVTLDRSVSSMADKAVQFIDNKVRERYDYLKKHKLLHERNIGYMEIHYLYARSFYTDIKVKSGNKEAFNYWLGQAEKYWLGETPYMNAMAAVALFRHGKTKIAKKIIESLRERAIYNEELGMYYKENMGGYYWYQFPIETQATIIEAFAEISKDTKTVNQLKQWLLKMKQVQGWKTTKATVDAVYALLMRGDNWLKNKGEAKITVGDIKIEPEKMGAKVEAGTGHFKVAWRKEKIKPEMGKVTVDNPNTNPAWGALYWQYFEDLDKITPHKTPLALEKDIFLEVKTPTGVKLEKVTDSTKLAPGDRLKVRVVLRSDRDMEYIHMRDMRPAGTEPENVISRHKYQDGLWYYESTKDTSTDFFMERLNKGTYVFEYPLLVNLRGDFSAGITTIQCMYAPEFASHSKGIRVEVK